MSESDEQIALFDLIRRLEGKYPLLKRVYHVPNGGMRHKATAGRLKAEGVRPGVLDINVDVPRWGDIVGEIDAYPVYELIPGLRIEMKFGRNRPTAEQKDWLEYYKLAGYQTAVCYTSIEAWNVIVKYLGYDELVK